MYDSIHIRIPIEKITVDQLAKAKANTKFEKNTVNRFGRIATIHSFANLQVAFTVRSVCINGSIPKYYLGNNAHTLTPNQNAKAILQLQREIGLPLLKGYVARVDIADCLPLKHSIVHYFNSLLNTPNYSRDVGEKLSRGVRYRQDNIVLAFYNKTDEAAQSGSVKFAGITDVLRLELRYLKNVRRSIQRSMPPIKVVHLLSSLLQKKLALSWCERYNEIVKKTMVKDDSHVQNWSDCKSYMLTQLLHTQSLPYWYSIMDSIAANNSWASRTLCDAKRCLKIQYSSSPNAKLSKYILDMDRQIQQTTVYKIAHGLL